MVLPTHCNRPKWMTFKTAKDLKRKSNLWSRYRETGHLHHLFEYEKLNHDLKHRTRSEKISFEENLAALSKISSKQFYTYAKSMQKTKPTIGPLLSSNILESDPQTMANILNVAFQDNFASTSTVKFLHTPKPNYICISP